MAFSLTTLMVLCTIFISVSFGEFLLPTDPNLVSFWLYPNPANPADADELVYLDATSIEQTRYNPSLNCIIYSSGFMQNRTTDQAIKNAYLRKGFASTNNIIVVDWSQLNGNKAPPLNLEPLPADVALYLSLLPLYIESANNVAVVAGRVQEFLSFLMSSNLLLAGPANVHLVGQSLGAHVQGLAARGFKSSTNKAIGRVTGTEPAGPLFEAGVPLDGLRSDDATFVDVIHTNAGVAGYLGSLGKVDFYINGGTPITPNVQPACLAPANLTNIFCSHNLAVQFYADSIDDVKKTMKACSVVSVLTNKCCVTKVPLLGLCLLPGTEVQFGEYCPSGATGNYYLNISVA